MNLLRIRKYLIRQHFSDPKLKNPDELIKGVPKKVSHSDLHKMHSDSTLHFINAFQKNL